MRTLCLVLLVVAMPAGAQERVVAARTARRPALVELFRAVNVVYPPAEVLLRAFKHERVLELWASNRGQPMVRVKAYEFCAASGALGPKRREGDQQVPEGFYRVVHFNPWSNFHLSLGLDYPNASDRKLGTGPRLGGAIYIHGGCASIGCIAIEDGPIEELYVALSEAGNRSFIPVHIFPRRFESSPKDAAAGRADPTLDAFWASLRAGYEHFERTRRPPRVRVDPKNGLYRLGESR